MDEPPILPNDDSTPPQVRGPQYDNPYTPGHIEPQAGQLDGLRTLPGYYWATLAVAFLLSLAGSYFYPGVGIPAAIALVSAAIRVPLMRIRPRPAVLPPLPQPLTHLLISTIFCVLFGFAAVCGFCIVCLPLGFMTFGLNGQGDAIPLVFGFSGIIGLLVYGYLIRLSLKMSW